MRHRGSALGALLLAVWLAGEPEAATDGSDDIAVAVEIRGDNVVIDADLDFPAPRS